VSRRLRTAVETVGFALVQPIEARDDAAAIAAFATTAAREAADVAAQFRRLSSEAGILPPREPEDGSSVLAEARLDASRRLAPFYPT